MSAPVQTLAARAVEFIGASKAASTLRAYRSDWEHFSNWCKNSGLSALPTTPEIIAMYLAALAESHRPGTLTRRLTSISQAHRLAGYRSPAGLEHAVVADTLKGIRRTFGVAQEGKRPLLTVDVRKIVQTLPDNLQGIRDRALLLVGFAGGFRRSELAALNFDDVETTEEGLVITLRRSKTDPEGQGRKVGVPRGSKDQTCPVKAFERWRHESGLSDGAVFRGIDRHGRLDRENRLHKDSIGLIVKRAAKAAGLNPSEYAGHSLRSGLATQAYLNGAGEFATMKQTGHKSPAMLRKYIRDASLFRDNPASRLGL